MTIEEAKAIVYSLYPGATHIGHGTANEIIERLYTAEEKRAQTYPRIKRLSQMFVIFSHWPIEIQQQLDTAMWVQAAMAVLAEKNKGFNDYQYFSAYNRA